MKEFFDKLEAGLAKNEENELLLEAVFSLRAANERYGVEFVGNMPVSASVIPHRPGNHDKLKSQVETRLQKNLDQNLVAGLKANEDKLLAEFVRNNSIKGINVNERLARAEAIENLGDFLRGHLIKSWKRGR